MLTSMQDYCFNVVSHLSLLSTLCVVSVVLYFSSFLTVPRFCSRSRVLRDASCFPSACYVCWCSCTYAAHELQPAKIVHVWYRIAVILVELEGRHFLSVVEYGSCCPELLHQSGIISRHVIAALCSVFARYGFPTQLGSDNDPWFVSTEVFGSCNKSLSLTSSSCPFTLVQVGWWSASIARFPVGET